MKVEDLNKLRLTAKKQWWLRSHNGETPCPSCGFFDSLEKAQQKCADNQETKRIFLVREV